MSAFANKVVLITGAGSGIGRQFALALAGEDAKIAALDLQLEPLQELSRQISGKPFALAVADVTDRPTLKAAIAKLTQQLGPVDLLIACAGVGMETPARDFSSADFAKIIQVNLIGVANSIDAVLPEMIVRRTGHLVALSSLASFRGLPLLAGYCASKSGVNGLMDALRVELRPLGIHVTTLCPGWVRTPMTEQIKGNLPGILDVDDAVHRMLKAIKNRKAVHAFPRWQAFQVKTLRWLPTWFSDFLVRRMFKKMLNKEQ